MRNLTYHAFNFEQKEDTTWGDSRPIWLRRFECAQEQDRPLIRVYGDPYTLGLPPALVYSATSIEDIILNTMTELWYQTPGKDLYDRAPHALFENR
jgi:hypothetical protein